MALLSSCGGGGGGGSTGGGGCNQICITANFKSVSTVALTTTTGVTTQMGLVHRIQSWIDNIFPSAFADSPKTVNILGYDASGNAVENPLISNVNLYIAGVVSSPDGKDVYLFLDDNQNQTLYADYRAMQGNRCLLYKIVKDSGIVTCLMDSKYAISNPGRNPVEYGNRAEPYIKFDAAGNLYMMAYKPDDHSSTGHRLYKISSNSSPVIMKDYSDGDTSGQNVVYAKNGNLFYTQVSCCSSKAFIFDTVNGIFNQISALDNQYIEKIATSLDGEVYVKVGTSIFKINQSTFDVDEVNVHSDGYVLELTRNPSGGVYALMSNGNILKINENTTEFLSGVGLVAFEPNRNPETDLFYQKMIVNNDWISVRGSSTDLGESVDSPAVCLISLKTLEKKCETLKSSNPIFYSFAYIGEKMYAFFTSGGIFKQATVNISQYFSSSASYVVSNSTAGNGSVVSSISMRPPITFVADLTSVTTTTSDSLITVSNPVSDTYTYLSFTSASSITGITSTDLGLKNSSGSTVDAKFKIVDKVIYAAVTDTSGTKSSGFQTLGSTNDYSLVFPSSYTAPALTNGIGTKTGYFPVIQRSSIMYLDFSAPVVNLDLAALQLTDASGVSVPSTISMAKEGLRLEIRVKDSDAANLTGFKILPTGSVYKLTLPSRVRLPGQTFLSPFDRTQIVFTTTS